jgi:hypothetical protein
VIAEAHIGGVLFAPIVVYMIAAAMIFTVLRALLGRIGLLARVWHPALFELALYTAILSLLVRLY